MEFDINNPQKLFEQLGIEPRPLSVKIPEHIKKGTFNESATALFGVRAGEVCTGQKAVIPNSNLWDSADLLGTTQIALCEVCKAPFDVEVAQE